MNDKHYQLNTNENTFKPFGLVFFLIVHLSIDVDPLRGLGRYVNLILR